jgi:hypothetical protein
MPLPKAKLIVYYSLIWRFKLFSLFSFAGWDPLESGLSWPLWLNSFSFLGKIVEASLNGSGGLAEPSWP